MAVYLKRNKDLKSISVYMEESQKLVSMVLLNLIKIDYEVKFSQLEFEVLSVSMILVSYIQRTELFVTRSQ